MKIKSKGGIVQKDNIAGIVNIEDWKGATMRIDIKSLQRAIDVLTRLREVGLDAEEAIIGISEESQTEEKPGVFCVFFDSNKTVAYAVMGKWAKQ